jgi:hypothetical protein
LYWNLHNSIGSIASNFWRLRLQSNAEKFLQKFLAAAPQHCTIKILLRPSGFSSTATRFASRTEVSGFKKVHGLTTATD